VICRDSEEQEPVRLGELVLGHSSQNGGPTIKFFVMDDTWQNVVRALARRCYTSSAPVPVDRLRLRRGELVLVAGCDGFARTCSACQDELDEQAKALELLCTVCYRREAIGTTFFGCLHLFCRACLGFELVTAMEDGRDPSLCPQCGAQQCGAKRT
jgi:hypothetical protein